MPMGVPRVALPAVALIAGALLACDGDGPVTPPEPARFELSSERATDFAVALEDLDGRILPHLGEPARVADLDAALVELSDALRTRVVGDLVAALRNSDDSVVALAAGPDGAVIAADLESVRLVLDEARRLVEPMPAAQ